jgi:hypothetical protein
MSDVINTVGDEGASTVFDGLNVEDQEPCLMS